MALAAVVDVVVVVVVASVIVAHLILSTGSRGYRRGSKGGWERLDLPQNANRHAQCSTGRDTD